jgi:Na+-translocating ferredoxin:NAD+ oxidoreductase subunit E
MHRYQKILTDGLWHNNQALVAILGLCPLLAVSSSVVNALGMGLATTLTLILTNAVTSALRKWIPNEIRIPVFVLLIAGVVTIVQLWMQARFYSLYQVLGIFVPLIVTNCTIIARAEAFAYKNPILPSLVDGLAIGLGSTLVLVTLGALREMAGYGTLLRQADLLFGASARDWTVHLGTHHSGFLLAVMPAGAFFGLSLLIAVKNGIQRIADARTARRSSLKLTTAEQT